MLDSALNIKSDASTLAGIFPVNKVRERFPEAKEVTLKGMGDYPKYKQHHSDKLFSMGLHQWDRLVEWGPPKLDMYAVSEYISPGKPGLIEFINDMIGEPLIKDFLYHHFTVDRGGHEITVAEFAVALLYPGDLHLSHIYFCNPDRPISPEKRHWKFQEYEGLGLLDPTIAAFVKKAQDIGCRAASLTAVTAETRDLFNKKYGFNISDTKTGRVSHKPDSVGIPIEISFAHDKHG